MNFTLPRSRPANQKGFTLLEVLLAFVVFALSFATALEILSVSTRGTVRAREDTEVALLVQSVMDAVGVDIPVQEGGTSGEIFDKYAWDLVISPFEPFEDQSEINVLELAEQSGTTLYMIDLEIRWQSGSRERVENFVTVRGRLEGVR